MSDDTTLSKFVERYNEGQLPWDDVQPPPEVMALAAGLQPGRVLDLGCGYGRTALYLAQQGWQVDGVDFVPQAIAEAQKRATAASLSERIHFHVASVTELGFLPGRYQCGVDVGCFHALDEAQQKAYHVELCRLLEPGSPFLLFVRMQEENQSEEGPHGVSETAVKALFAQGFTLDKTEIGVTEVGEKSWKSGWFWFRRESKDGSLC
ncbi:MAG: class I SAM-dependent methyltransferase [Chloroflexi bacterium]|nr:class I SAM-dependent methyltransferase [Chloroflexota bacterium]